MWVKITLKDIFSDYLDGHEELAKGKLRQLIKQSGGVERISVQTGIPSKSIHRMISDKGNPTSRNLFLILGTLCG
jgi:DNA-binding phage protein